MSVINEKICRNCPHCLDDEGMVCEFIVDYVMENQLADEDLSEHTDKMIEVAKRNCPYILEHTVL